MRTNFRFPFALTLALAGSAAAGALAQQPAPAAPSAAAAPNVPAPAAVDPRFQKAVGLAKAARLKEAIAELEAMRREGTATPPATSLLGALYGQVGRAGEALAVLRPLADAPDAAAATLYNAGRAALMLKQPALAQNYFTRSVALEATSPSARELGLLLAHQGKVVEAYRLLRPWSLTYPTDGEALLTAAALALLLERPNEAEQMIAGMSPTDPAIVLMRAKIQIQKGEGAPAAKLLTPLLMNHPQGMESEIRRALAEADLLAGQPQQAVELLKGRAPGHPALALILARAQHKTGDVLGGLVTLRSFADKLPDDARGVPDPRVAAGIAVEYGALLVDAGRGQEAIPMLERATRIEPNRQEAWQTLGRVLTAAGRKEEGQKATAHAAELAAARAEQQKRGAAESPSNQSSLPPAGAMAPAAEPSRAGVPGSAAPTHGSAGAPQAALPPELQQAVQLIGDSKNEEALAVVRRRLAAQPNDVLARSFEVRLLMMQKRPQEALAVSEAALAAQPGNADLLYNRGAAQMALHHLDEAEKDFRRVLALTPQAVTAMNDLAVLLTLKGNRAEARQLFERILQLRPGDPAATESLDILRRQAAGKSGSQ
jgi:tetratricopeptide (TPR) repeat protein